MDHIVPYLNLPCVYMKYIQFIRENVCLILSMQPGHLRKRGHPKLPTFPKQHQLLAFCNLSRNVYVFLTFIHYSIIFTFLQHQKCIIVIFSIVKNLQNYLLSNYLRFPSAPWWPPLKEPLTQDIAIFYFLIANNNNSSSDFVLPLLLKSCITKDVWQKKKKLCQTTLHGLLHINSLSSER